MTNQRFFDYLVIGGEHDKSILNGPMRSVLEIPVKKQRKLAKFYAQSAEPETLKPETIDYKVIEHITPDGRHYLIASNDDLTNVDVEQAILDAGLTPIN